MIFYKKIQILISLLFINFLSCNYLQASEQLNRKLFKATTSNQIEKIKEAIQLGANIDAKDHLEDTSLMMAAYLGFTDIVKLLVSNQARLGIQSSGGQTALHYAAQNGHADIVKYLVEKRANIEAKDKDKWTPLQYAAFTKHIDIVTYLAGKGANINAPDNENLTPLFYAIRRNHSSVAQCLLTLGADTTSVELHALPDSSAKRKILSVFDAFKPEIKQELKDVKQASGQKQESEQEEHVRPIRKTIIEAYKQFLHGDHNDLRNLLLVLPHVMRKTMSNDHLFIERTPSAMQTVFKKESIKPLLYFLAETRWQRNMADDLISNMKRKEQASLELDSMIAEEQ